MQEEMEKKKNPKQYLLLIFLTINVSSCISIN